MLLVEGAVAWHRRVSEAKGKAGPGPCVAIDAAVDQYRHDNDHASCFIEECLEVELDHQWLPEIMAQIA